MVARTYDRTGEFMTLVHNLKAKKPVKPPKRHPRPYTAQDRIELELTLRHMESLEDDYEAAVARYQAREESSRGKEAGGTVEGE